MIPTFTVYVQIVFELPFYRMEKKGRSLASDFPVVITNKITDWKILKYTENDWCNLFEDKLLEFRQGRKTYTEEPYWERLCESKTITLRQFFELSSQKKATWLYYDYKYVKDVFPENKKFSEEIKWADLKLSEFHGQDSTLWIGNEGAHTPCHMDTYGCNFVAQIFGRKLWILIPPDGYGALGPVRVPYEESTIYSSQNFYTPTDSLLEIKEAFKVILSPGDVLYVPKHWWHYVENLEVAISVNLWVPLNSDHDSRLGECLVQHYISCISQDLTETEAKELLNPSEYSLLTQPCTLVMIQKCIENCKRSRQEAVGERRDMFEVMSVFKDDLMEVTLFDAKSYINEKAKNHNYNSSVKKEEGCISSARVTLAKMLINSYCHPSNISLVKNSLMKP